MVDTFDTLSDSLKAETEEMVQKEKDFYRLTREEVELRVKLLRHSVNTTLLNDAAREIGMSANEWSVAANQDCIEYRKEHLKIYEKAIQASVSQAEAISSLASQFKRFVDIVEKS